MVVAIPLAEIRAYCGLFDVADVEEFVRLIRAMDDAVLARVAERRGAEANEGG
jgi:hypothetical protein